MPLWVVQ
jgi:hypothetical protein